MGYLPVFLMVAQMSTPGQAAFTALDADKNGNISRLEATADPNLTLRFSTLDQNLNDALEPAEFARFETPMAPGSTGNPSRLPAPMRVPPPMDSVPPPLGTSPAPAGSTEPPPRQ